MAIQVNQPTEEETSRENSRQEELQGNIKKAIVDSKLTADIIGDLGLSPESKPEPKKKVEEKKDEVETEEETEEEVEKETEEETTEEEEEVVPKSKIQPRIDKLTATIKALQEEVSELRTKKAEPSDEITRQLEAMSVEQLKAAKLEARKLQIRNKDDDAKLSEFVELEDKIDRVINEAPKRFNDKQVEALKRMATKIASSGEIPDVDKIGPELFKRASEIYQKYPSLQKDIEGQATALEMAAELYKITSTKTGDKTKETELKRQVNTLKKKTTLDTGNTKGNPDTASLEKMKKDAIGGTMSQKLKLIRTHPAFNVSGMIPDEFREK